MLDHKTNTLGLGALLAGGVLVALPPSALARTPLSEQPAVRHKVEMRQLRLELTPTFDMSVAQDYKDTFSAGLKLEYHLTDSLSFGGAIFAGTSVNSGLSNQIRDSLPDTTTPGDPTPTRTQFDEHLNTTPLHGSLHATLTPWFGKMAFFGKAYVNFDVYFTGGLGFAQTKNDFGAGDTCTVGDGFIDTDGDGVDDTELFNDPRNDCPHNAGFNAGLMLGAGIHLYFNDWVGLDISFKDYFYSDNPSGLDFTGDLKVDSDDRRFLGHFFFGVGVSFYLPTKAKRSP